MSDPLGDFKAYLEASTTMPHFLVLVLAYVLVVAGAAAYTWALKAYAREGAWTKVTILVLIFGIATFLWWHRGFGATIIALCLLVLFRRPLVKLTRFLARRKRASRAED